MSKIQNIDVRFNASSNFSKVRSDLAALQAQAASLNAVFEKGAYAKGARLVDPVAWQTATSAITQTSRVYRDAASSSGLFNTQQIRATTEAERYTKALQKQKLTMGEMLKHRGIMKEVYRDQLRMQRMTAQYWGTDSLGRAVTDITMPKNVPQDLDTMRRKMGMFGNMAASAGTQVVNMGKNIQWAGRQLTVGFTYPLTLFGAAAGVMAYKTEDAFSRIAKVYDFTAKAQVDETQRMKELNNLRVESMDNARKAAELYGSTIVSTLEVEQQLAATGLKGPDLFSATNEVQRISMLGDIDSAQTTEMVVSLQTAFRKSIPDAAALTDTLNFMNAASNASSLSLQDIAEATPRAASGLAQLGVDAREMVILLTSMREAGVNAAEGANALKSATARILNPAILQKGTDIFKEFGANINLEKISDKAGGNFMEFIRMLGIAEAKAGDLTNKQKQTANAALFGTYQFNRLNAALVNTADAYAFIDNKQNGVNNQTAKVIKLSEQSTEELQRQADISKSMVMENAAGKFRREWAMFQGELAKMGGPFLEAATKILGIFTKIGKWFNNLDDTKKSIAMWAAALLAIAGPVIMLSGLFMNLFGQLLKGVGATMKFIGVSKLFNKEERAAQLTVEAQNKALMQQTEVMGTLTKEVQVLTAAYEAATRAAQTMMQSTGKGAVAPGVAGGAGPVYGQRPAPVTSAVPYGPILPPPTTAYTYTRGTNAAETAANREAARNAASRAQLATEAKIKQQAAATQKIKESTAKTMQGMSGSMIAMSAAMAAMMVTDNKFVNSLGKWLLIGTLVVPAVKTVATWTAAAAKSAWSMAAANMAAARASTINAAGAAAAVGPWKTITAGATGLAGGIAKAIGPGGVLTLAIAAVGGAYYWAYQKGNEAERKAEEIAKQQKAAAETVSNNTKNWLESVGKVANEYDRIYQTSIKLGPGPGAASEQEKLIDYYKTNPEGDAPAPVDAFKDLGADLDLALVQKYVDLQVEAGMSAEEAGANIRALYIAMGESAAMADYKSQQLVDTWGSVNKKTFDWKGFLVNQMNSFNNATAPEFEARGRDAAEAFSAGLAYYQKNRDPEGAKELVDNYIGDVTNSIEKTVNELGEKYVSGGWFEFLKAQGVTSIKEFNRWLQTNSMDDLENLDWNVRGKFNLPRGDILPVLEDAKERADALLKALDDIMHFGPGVPSLIDLPEFGQVEAITLTYKEQRGIVKEMVREQKLLGDLWNGTAEATQLATLNAYLYANGLKTSKDWAKAVYNFMNRVEAGTKDAKEGAEDVDDAVQGIDNKTVVITLKQVGGIVQTAMANVQEDMAASAMDKFNSGWDASMASAQSAWESRSTALQNKHEQQSNALENSQQAAQDAFERRWEKRKEAVQKAYDKRIENIQKEIEAEQKADETRQRLFENEKARLEALAEMQNANIDFNTALIEGRLDDAAKLQNDMAAKGTIEQMEAEERAAAARTQATIERLEKKNERLEKQRDKEMKRLEQMEERQKRHLDRMQEARSRALDKAQAQETAALEEAEERAMASMEKQRDYEEALLEERLELFKSYTARNQKDLERWMKKVGLTYDDFGEDVKAKGEEWSKYFEKSLSSHIRQAGMEIMNDNIWEKVGKEMGNKLLKGLGFANMTQFRNFVKTGSKGGSGGQGEDETRHEGGIVGSGKGSRKGVPRTYRGLHPSEKMIRAQKGEYVVNKKASEKHAPLLEAINNGVMDPSINRRATNGIMGGFSAEAGAGSEMGLAQLTGLGMAGLVAGTIANQFKQGINNSLMATYARAQKKWSQPSGSYKGMAGTYSGMSFDAGQMKNAATIASVGSSMGMSKRDIEIGIMTAITESMLRNVNYGDRDSLGLFQQRPSMGWGTAAQVTDPKYASTKFFSVLRGVTGRDAMTPWMAAQTVQRSAYSDGSNYQQYWDEAMAIFTKGLKKGRNGNYSAVGPGGGYQAGEGGTRRPINVAATSGIHGGSDAGNPPALDFAAVRGTPVYAIADGRITKSYDIAGPLSSDSYDGDGPYGSFGRTISMVTDGGHTALYAHLDRRSVTAGQRVRGGAVIGYSGNTGNSSGPHLHFGATNGPYAWLRSGGEVKWDNTKAVLHQGETVLTKTMTQRFKENVANGGGDSYTVTVDLRGAYIREELDIEKAVSAAIDNKQNKLGRKRVVK